MKRTTSSFRARALTIVSLAAISPLSHAQLQNGDFTQIGANGNPWTTIGPKYGPGDESAAAHWYQFVPTPSGHITSEIVSGFGPGGSNALHISTDSGVPQPFSFGSGVTQFFALRPSADFSCDLFVQSGFLYGGLVSTSGPFFDQTRYGYTGQWVHISQSVSSPSASVGFENLEPWWSPADFYIANAWMSPVPEPASMMALGLGIAALIRRRRNQR